MRSVLKCDVIWKVSGITVKSVVSARLDVLITQMGSNNET